MRRLRYLGWTFLVLLLMGLAGWIVYWGYAVKLRSQWSERATQIAKRLERTLSDRRLQVGVFAESLATRLGKSRELEIVELAEDPLIRRLGVSEIILHTPDGARVLYATQPVLEESIWRATLYDFSRTNAPQSAVELTNYGARILDIEPFRREGATYGLEVAIGLQDFLREFARLEGVELSFVVPAARWSAPETPGFAARGLPYKLLATSSKDALEFLNHTSVGAHIGESSFGMLMERKSAYAVMMLDGVEYRSSLLPSVSGASALVLWMDYSAMIATLNAQRRAVLLLVWLVIASAGVFVMLFGARYRRRIQAKLNAARDALNASNSRLRHEVAARQHVEERLRGIADEMYAARLQDRQMLESLAHEMKLNASATLGFAEILCSEKIPDAESLQSLSALGGRIFFMAENVDLWARQEMLTPALNLHPLRNIAERAWNELSRLSSRKKISVSFNIPESVYIRADAMLLSMALKNLFSNAIRFSNPDSTVVAEARELASGVEISVVDLGMGIPREIMEHLFEISAERVRRDTEGEKGLGLGLVLVNAVAKIHDAKLRVTSDEGQGCRVTLLFPSHAPKR